MNDSTERRKEYMRNYFRKYNQTAKQKQYHSEYYKQSDVRQRIRDRHNSNPEVIARREARLKWRAERAAYRQTEEYKEILRERCRISHKKRVASGKNKELCRRRWYGNPQHRLASNMRRLVHQALSRTKVVKSKHLLELLGCSIPEFKSHLESQFQIGMTWKNMGAWEIDHRVPLASFNLADPEQQKLAFSFHNCRPLWKEANRKKSDKIGNVRGRDIRKIIQFKVA